MSKLGLNRELQKFRNTKKALMTLLVKRSAKHFNTNFRLQGFRETTSNTNKWQSLKKPRKNGTKTPILVDTGNLKRDVTATAHSGTHGSVTFNADYASYHNEGNPKGLKVRVEGGAFPNLPQRQFAGDSKVLNDFNEKIILSYIKRKFRR